MHYCEFDSIDILSNLACFKLCGSYRAPRCESIDESASIRARLVGWRLLVYPGELILPRISKSTATSTAEMVDVRVSEMDVGKREGYSGYQDSDICSATTFWYRHANHNSLRTRLVLLRLTCVEVTWD